MKKTILLSIGLFFGIAATNAQVAATADCKQTCDITKVIEEGPFLGVQINNGPGNYNAQIIRVIDNTAAQKCGFVVGDIITKVDATEITSNFHLVSVIGAHQPGDKVMITYIHAGVQNNMKVRIGAKSTRVVTEKICCEDVKSANGTVNDLLIYPNPAVNNVTIKTKEFFEGDVNVSVFDLQGREVLSSTVQNNGRFNQSIDVSTLGAGEYIVKLNNGTSSYTDKLFVTR
jgi:hypothetical protein